MNTFYNVPRKLPDSTKLLLNIVLIAATRSKKYRFGSSDPDKNWGLEQGYFVCFPNGSI